MSMSKSTSSSGEGTHLKLVTVSDFDPRPEQAIEYEFIGRVIAGRYTVRAHIGGGGMADVFRASDEELGIDVAIKLLKPQMASDELRARMVQEARAAAQVRHDNVVRVFGAGMLDATAYIAMELLEGPNLEQYVREYRDQRVPWREALTLMLPALEALHAIHERGYVHRDIKTGNILIAREVGGPPRAIVIDLGLVKPDRALRCATSPPTTEVGRMLCTPGYTSPEQAAGLPVDRRSDVYSMAVTLYRVLAGRLPFHDARGQPVAVVLARHIYNAPTMLAEAAADADIAPAVARVIESALRKRPIERPQTMLAFAAALRVAAASVAPEATPGRPRGSMRSMSHGLRLLLAMGLGVVAVLLALSGPRSRLDGVGEPQAARLRVEDTSPTGQGVGAGGAASSGEREAATPPREAPQSPIVMVEVPAAARGPQAASRPGAANARSASRRPDPERAWHRALALRTADVQRCADKQTGSLERLAVAVSIDREARISAQVVGAADTPLSRCVGRALRHTPLIPPPEQASLIHTFTLRTTPLDRP